MATFSIGEAVKSGFVLIWRNPKAIAVWGFAYFIVGLLPSILAMILVGGWGKEEESVNVGALLVSQGLSNLGLVGSILLAAVLASAVCRACLQPDESSRWYLRVGQQELWVGLVSSVIAIALVLAAVTLLSPLFFAMISVFVGADLQITAYAMMLAFGVAVVAVLAWVAIRFSLAIPMSFERSAFVLLESWAMTRGHALRMFLAYISVTVSFLVLQIVVGAVFLGAAAGAALLYGARIGLSFNEVMAQPPGGLALLVAPLFFVLITSLSAISYPITIAPVVTIYRRLSEAETP